MEYDNGLDLGTYDWERNDQTKASNMARPTWRSDPDESLSDYTIVVKPKLGIDSCTDSDAKKPRISQLCNGRSDITEETDTYHVHKFTLGTGRRKSEYFSKIFRANMGMKEGETSRSIIELDASAIIAFPDMLDFIYVTDEPAKLTTNNAVALRHLANYFGIRELFQSATDFIRNDLSPPNIPTYLSEANIYLDEKLFDATIRVCAEKIERMDSAKISALSPEFLEKVVSSPYFKCESALLSSKVAAFFRSHLEDVDAAIFHSLTSAELMPMINPEEAIFFLKTARDRFGEERNKDYDSLYDRCIAARSTKWEGLVNERLTKDHHDENSYSDLPSNIKEDIFESALIFAHEDYNNLRRKISTILQYVQIGDLGKLRILDDGFSKNAFGKNWTVDYDYVRYKRNEFPDVIVGGAGMEAINGRYTLTGTHDGVGVYMNGIFSLFRLKPKDQPRSWHISILPLHEYDDDDVNFYQAPATNNTLGSGSERPPRDGWECAEVGQLPAPSLH